MAGKVADICDILSPDQLGTQITDMFMQYKNLRRPAEDMWKEVRQYVFATDTTFTTNSKLPWKNKTTIPKLCQIRDLLFANYNTTIFASGKPVIWEANEKDSDSTAKRDAITNYMMWVMGQPTFKDEMDKVILDYIDYGNCFVTVDWVDQRVQTPSQMQSGYVGPVVRRISPLDIVMNPTAETFESSPKIVRTITSMGEVKEMIERLSTSDNAEEMRELFDYLKKIRGDAANSDFDWQQKDDLYFVDGFSSFRDYLLGDTVEILTFYGDIYDKENDIFLKNHVVTVVDRHKVIGKRPNPSYFGYPPIFHAGWRKRQDNLWAMGPLDNLIGLQYRLDHLENMKADIMDLTTFPVQKVKGLVQDYNWQPGGKIFVDEEGDVEILQPDVQLNQLDNTIQMILTIMEEMAGAPKEAMGFRTPGEKTKYEVSRLENAASRVFQAKIRQFDMHIVENTLNAMLELARRNMSQTTTIKVFDDELKVAAFMSLSSQDITGVGRIKPVGSRHFSEQAELIQNLTNLTNSNLWPTVQPHFSGIKLSKIVEEIFDLSKYEVVMPYVALSEQADAQKMTNTLQENVMQHASTASGMGNDYDVAADGSPLMKAQLQDQTGAS